MTSDEHYVETAQGRIYIEVEGDPSAELVLLATGGPGASHDHYHPWFSRLVPGFRICYVDYIGCGLSDRLEDPTRYTIELLAENLEAIRAYLQAERLSLIGISFGGFAAVEYALNRPGVVRRLILSNAHVSAAGWQRTNIDGVNAELARLFPEAWREILELRARGTKSLDERYQELVSLVLPDLEWVEPWNHPPLDRPEHGRGFEPVVYEAMIGTDPEWEVTGTLEAYDRTAELGRLPETLVLTGRYDRLTPPGLAEEIHAALDPHRRRLHTFERSAHRPWAEEPDLYFEVVRHFLSLEQAES